ncbi:hypothetical protein KUTeg_000353 [Tegillarca granosa]|uniref:Cadherin domain-containing protein n=1 Tax=Tegillarca granosa TaxID=220873 RepID=A0ABQ9G0Q9_TEGGR|nr:hypothetical protein KUTeg_000353 [Tegillarca granosa]
MNFERMERKNTLFSLLCTILLSLDEIFAASPVITNLPSTVSVGESETADRSIFFLSTSDADGDPVSCSVQSSTPASAPFRTLQDTILQKTGVYTDNATFNFATTATYLLTIRCTDGTNNVDGVLTVNVIDNDLLDITNLPATETRDASTTGASVTIFTCTHSDALSHTTITYSMMSIPASSSFTISTAGVVTTTQALNLETNSQILLYITVTDSFISLTEVLTVQLTNVNNIPHFSNLPNTVSVSESVASGYVFYTLTPTDLDAGATLSYTMDVQPATHAGYISLNTLTNQVSLVTGFNYEDVNYFNLSFTITDGLASNTETLNVIIVNAHEGCYFHQAIYYVTTVEGAAGSNSLNPGFVIQDYDGTTTWTLEFLPGNNSERFSIANTGLISFAVDYNIDNSAMASTVILTVKCVDTTGQTGTTKVQITIGMLMTILLCLGRRRTLSLLISTLLPGRCLDHLTLRMQIMMQQLMVDRPVLGLRQLPLLLRTMPLGPIAESISKLLLSDP